MNDETELDHLRVVATELYKENSRLKCCLLELLNLLSAVVDTTEGKYEVLKSERSRILKEYRLGELSNPKVG